MIERLNMYKVINFMTKTIKNWKVELTAEEQTLEEVEIQIDIF